MNIIREAAAILTVTVLFGGGSLVNNHLDQVEDRKQEKIAEDIAQQREADLAVRCRDADMDGVAILTKDCYDYLWEKGDRPGNPYIDIQVLDPNTKEV